MVGLQQLLRALESADSTAAPHHNGGRRLPSCATARRPRGAKAAPRLPLIKARWAVVPAASKVGANIPVRLPMRFPAPPPCCCITTIAAAPD
jgi:hypothetical protein